MNSRATISSLRRVLRQELRRHRGQIGDLEVRLGHRRGYLSRVLRTPSLTLRTLLAVLEHLTVDVAGFFALVFDRVEAPEDLLAPIGKEASASRAWRRIEKATQNLARRCSAAESHGNGGAEFLSPMPPVVDVEAFSRCHLQEQRRRLSSTRKYRQRAFVEPYLEHLERILETRPDAVRQLTEALAVSLVPLLEGDRLLALQCRVLGVYASAEMILGAEDDAARALSTALNLAQGREFAACRADLLERGARLLWARRQPRRALYLLERAQLLHFELGQRPLLGRILADRGAILNRQGDHRGAIRVLTQALSHLSVEREGDHRYRALILKRLADAHEHLGDLAGARAWQRRVLRAQPGQREEWLETPWDSPPGAVRGQRWRRLHPRDVSKVRNSGVG